MTAPIVVSNSSFALHQRFILGQKVALRVHHGKYMVAEGGSVYTHYNDHGGKGHFTIKVLYGDIVEIMSHHHKYVAMGYGGEMYVSHSHHDHDTKFHLEFYDGKVAFRNAHHNRWIGIYWFGTLRGHHELTKDELFEEIPVNW